MAGVSLVEEKGGMWFVIGCLVCRYGGGDVEHGEKWRCQSTVNDYDEARVLGRAAALYARVLERAGVVPELLSRVARQVIGVT